MGRPSDYKPEYCKKLLDHMEEGLSFESFGAIPEVSKQTLYTWTEKHAEFLDAKRKGEIKSLLWWERQGKKGLWDETSYGENGKPEFKKTLNSTVWIFNMKNRHKWRDRHEIETQVAEVNPAVEWLKKLSTEQLLDLIKSKTEGKE